MFLTKSVCLSACLLLLSGCYQPERPHDRAVHAGDPDSAAGKAGKLAYKVEKETEKAAREAGKKLDQAARDAHAGFKEAEKKTDR